MISSRTTALPVALLLTASTLCPAAVRGASRPWDGTALQALTTQGLRAEVAALLLSGQRGGAVGTRLEVLRYTSEPSPYVEVLLEVDGASLLREHQDPELRIEIYLYALDAASGVKGFLNQAIRLDTDSFGQLVQSGGIKFFAHLRAAPEGTSIRGLVRNTQTEAVGLARLDLDAEPSIPVVLAEPLDDWLVAVEAPHDDLRVEPWVAIFDGEVYTARADHRLEVDGTMRLLADADGRLRGDAVLTQEGEMVRNGRLEDRGRERFGAHERRLLQLSEPIRYPGAYRLQLPDPLDTTFEFQVADVAEVAAGALPDQGDLSFSLSEKQLSDRYLEIAELLAREGTRAAGESLAEFEWRATGNGQFDNSVLLAASEMAAATRISQDDPERLVALMLLHSDQYRRYVTRRRFLLVAHAREMVQKLATLYASTSKRQDANQLAAHALASLAGHLFEAQLLRTAARFYSDALAVDPRHAGALLTLAKIEETTGDHRSSIGLLRRLIDSHPEHAEGHLRLGIALDQTGQERAAIDEFRKVLALDDAPLWTRQLAYQEGARALRSVGDTGDAIALLEKGHREYAGDEKIALELALLYDRNGRFDQATRTVEEATARQTDQGRSSRYHYGELRADTIDVGRRALLEAIQGTIADAPSTEGADTP